MVGRNAVEPGAELTVTLKSDEPGVGPDSTRITRRPRRTFPFQSLPERLTPFHDGFRKVGLPLPKLATGFELRIL